MSYININLIYTKQFERIYIGLLIMFVQCLWFGNNKLKDVCIVRVRC